MVYFMMQKNTMSSEANLVQSAISFLVISFRYFKPGHKEAIARLLCKKKRVMYNNDIYLQIQMSKTIMKCAYSLKKYERDETQSLFQLLIFHK